jgi:poly-gamma-glutamate synthesis protein (capsule biosynthesis protein)
LFGQELVELLQEGDIRVFNLETPLTDRETPIDKCGPCHRTSLAALNGILSIRPTILGLANNHIMDQGIDGLASTINSLDQNGILHTGAGKKLTEAARPLFLTQNGKTIGLYCCTEHEFSIASELEGGANPLDLLTSFDHIAFAKKQCDYLIILFHGGKEHYQYPSPNLQRWCRKMADSGADLIICQHSHCIGCEEDYSNAKIVYGQGNFIFDSPDNELWNTGLLIKVILQPSPVPAESQNSFQNGEYCRGDSTKVEYIPLRRSGNTIRLAKNNDRKKILEGFVKRSEEIKEPAFIKKNYETLAQSYFEDYFFLIPRSLKLIGLILKILQKIFGTKLLYRLVSKGAYFRHLNRMECEAHHELYVMGIKIFIRNSYSKNIT